MNVRHHTSIRSGLTVVEAVVAIVLVALIAGGVYHSMVVVSTAGMVTAQRVAAFGLCVDRLEEMRVADYAAVTSSNYQPAMVRVSDFGDAARLPLSGVRSNSVVNLLEPTRKQVTVTVTWKYRGKTYDESLTGVIFRRDAHAPTGSGAIVGGKVGIDPGNDVDNQFVLTLPDGDTVTREHLTQDYNGYSGPATCVLGKTKGNGNQNGLLVNGQAMSLGDAGTYQITSFTMAVRLYNDKIGLNGKAMGKWWIAITAVGADVVTK